ncbi:MAG: hypothetical protein HRT47_06850 [Candidatus Caenarcaniphilales bacterium]|nr:hypothetical protein [Candidatus Caenarcaniphilales bacterium]
MNKIAQKLIYNPLSFTALALTLINCGDLNESSKCALLGQINDNSDKTEEVRKSISKPVKHERIDFGEAVCEAILKAKPTNIDALKNIFADIDDIENTKINPDSVFSQALENKEFEQLGSVYLDRNDSTNISELRSFTDGDSLYLVINEGNINNKNVSMNFIVKFSAEEEDVMKYEIIFAPSLDDSQRKNIDTLFQNFNDRYGRAIKNIIDKNNALPLKE